MVVVLPAPLGPMNPLIPFFVSRFSPLRASIFPKLLVRSFVVTIFSKKPP